VVRRAVLERVLEHISLEFEAGSVSDPSAGLGNANNIRSKCGSEASKPRHTNASS
jgi:hypothetical protein